MVLRHLPLLLALALLLPAASGALLPWLGTAAAALSVIGVAYEFWRGRDYYIDRRIRDKALRNAATA
jgi:hypothetical protein